MTHKRGAAAGRGSERGHTLDRPPRPHGDRWVGCLADFEADRLGFLSRTRDEHGGLVGFDDRTTIVNDPDLARTVLDSRAGFEIIGNFLGRTLTPAELADRTRLRPHLNAGLRRSAVEHVGALAAVVTIAELERVIAEQGEVVDPLPSLERALGGAVAAYYVGAELAEDVRRATHGLLDALGAVFGNPFALPIGWPTPANLRVRRRHRRLRALLESFVDGASQQASSDDPYATAVARSALAAGHPAARVVDLLIGSLLAAQRVPAAGASWTLLELARSSDLRRRVVEQDGALRGVVGEALRLHPPTWLLRRVSTRPVSLGSYEFAAGHHFLVSPYLIHRDARVFDEAHELRPERWAVGAPAGLLTFGAGVHLCPGRDLGMLMLEAAAAAVVDRWEITDCSVGLRPDPRTTLLPDGLRIRFSERTGSGAAGLAAGLDPLGEALPGGLPSDPEGLPDLGPRDLAGAC